MTGTAAMAAALALAALLSTAPASAQQAGPAWPAQGDALAGARPVVITGPDGRRVETCADPSVVHNPRAGEPPWVMLCTSDPLHADDRHVDGSRRFRRLPGYVSDDLRTWRWHGEALAEPPPGATASAGLWAPELVRVGARWHLYYTITDTADAASPQPGCDADSAIGVALSDSPLGPWQPQPALVVAPRRAAADGDDSARCRFDWTFDPDLLVTANGRRILYYGSYGGGIFAQPLDAAGLRTVGAPVRITASHRYEGAEVVQRAGWYWLFVSSADCCRGPLTGYAVFVGRSRTPLGPFVDKTGRRLDGRRAGGTPAIVQDGGRWVGPGHNSVFKGAGGHWWTMLHAIDRHDGWLGDSPLNKRPALLGALHWGEDGWPVLAGTAPDPGLPRGTALAADGFDDTRAGLPWQPLPAGSVRRGGTLRLPTQAGDIHEDDARAVLPTTALPDSGDFVVSARVRLALEAAHPPGAALQAGIAVLRDDDAYAKLVVLALHDLQATEFAVEHPRAPGTPAAPGDPPRKRFGSSFVGPPGATWTDLRLHVWRRGPGEVVLRGCTRADDAGARWVCGATWVHDGLHGGPLRLGLVAMGGAGHAAWFDRVAVHAAAPMRAGGAGVSGNAR